MYEKTFWDLLVNCPKAHLFSIKFPLLIHSMFVYGQKGYFFLNSNISSIFLIVQKKKKVKKWIVLVLLLYFTVLWYLIFYFWYIYYYELNISKFKQTEKNCTINIHSGIFQEIWNKKKVLIIFLSYVKRLNLLILIL